MKTKAKKPKPSSFGDQIREAVRASGISQIRLAKATGLDQGGLSRFLRGQWISEESLNTLAAHLGLSVTAPEPKQDPGNE
jgi:transcriptional regulator with XRE-family HTH domain